jgi:hypothetical protein
MGLHRFSFAAPSEARKAPPNVWLPRAIIIGLIAGIAAALHLCGYPLF